MESDISITTERETMPWDSKSFGKHNKKLSGHTLKVAAAAANAALKSGKDEGAAVRIGNAAGNRARGKGSKKKSPASAKTS